MLNLESKIKGALYGYAIGDAMGASTEFMSKEEIKEKYGVVDDIIGGGYFKLKPGKGTDDTAMTLCVMDAIMRGKSEKAILDLCCDNFVHWRLTDGLGCGGCCHRAIVKNMGSSNHKTWLKENHEDDNLPRPYKSLGNGSLMRALPMALAGLPREMNVKQGSLTHNNSECNGAVMIYHDLVTSLLNDTATFDKLIWKHINEPCEPTGLISDTFNNVMYYAGTSRTFEESIIGPVNDGGDSDTIAAIVGGLTGCKFGVEAIPQRWIDKLDPKTKQKIEKFSNFLLKRYVQNKDILV